MIEASYGIIRDDAGRLLIVGNDYRDAGVGVLWGLPGGAREDGETLEACVVREIREEVGLDARPGRYVGCIERREDGFHLHAHLFEIDEAAGAPRIDPGDDDVFDWRFVQRDELEHFPESVLGRRRLLAYLDDPDAFPEHVLLDPGEE